MTKQEYTNKLKAVWSLSNAADFNEKLSKQDEIADEYISELEYEIMALDKALVAASARLFLCDNYENKPNWTYVYDKYIRYGKEEIKDETRD